MKELVEPDYIRAKFAQLKKRRPSEIVKKKTYVFPHMWYLVGCTNLKISAREFDQQNILI